MTTKMLKPQRTCVGCKKKFEQKNLLAITRLKSGKVIVNKDHLKNGRSVYLCANMLCLKRSRDRRGKNALEYGLKVNIPEKIWRELEQFIMPGETS